MAHVAPLFVDLPSQMNALKGLIGVEALTPLLRKEINHAIDLHAVAIDEPDKDDLEYRELLATTFERLMAHWAQIYENIVHRAVLVLNIANFQKVLVSKFVEDYSRLPCPLATGLLGFALERDVIIEDHYTAMQNNSSSTLGGSVDLYSLLVVLPLKEMMVDRRHVQTILRTIATSEGNHPGQTQHLVNQRDWQGLASAIIKDRQLALDFFTYNKPMSTFRWPNALSAEILNGLDKVQSMYFAELSNPSAFTLTTYAKKLSSTNLSMTGPAQISWTGLARSFYQRISNALPGGGTENDVGAADATPLVDSDQTD